MSDSAETATGLGSADDRDPAPRRTPSGGVERRSRNPLRRLLTFYRQVVAELRKVIWPTRRELVTYTVVVLSFVLFMVALVSLYDFGASQAVLRVFGDS